MVSDCENCHAKTHNHIVVQYSPTPTSALKYAQIELCKACEKALVEKRFEELARRERVRV